MSYISQTFSKELKMKAFIAFATLFVTVLAVPEPIDSIQAVLITVTGLNENEDDGMGMKSLLVETSPGVYEMEDLENSELDTSSSPSDIIYYFYTRQNPHMGLKIASPNDVYVLNNVKNSPTFDSKKDIVIFIHGWKDSNESDFNYVLRTAALDAYDINVFVVDWYEVARKNYLSSRYAVVRLGQSVAEFIQALVDNFSLDLDRLTIVGFSLGAHIAGNAGEVLNGNVGHIVGLDPALPLFNILYRGDRLDPSDAKFVQIIHTSGGALGFKASLGHADYFPNGGDSQKGCGLDIGSVCSHCRSWEFYAESLSSKNFLAKSCPNYFAFILGFCKSNTESYIGGLYPDYSASGDYYLRTAKNSPFALG